MLNNANVMQYGMLMLTNANASSPPFGINKAKKLEWYIESKHTKEIWTEKAITFHNIKTLQL